MNFEEFQNQSRFYVVGALEPGEVEEFEREREKFGKKAEDVVTQSYASHEAFALSLRSPNSFCRDQRTAHVHGARAETADTCLKGSSCCFDESQEGDKADRINQIASVIVNADRYST